MYTRPKPKLRREEGLSLEEVLIAFLDRIGWDGSEIVPALLDEHAHQLAEKQRAKLIADGYGPLDEDDDGICPCGSCSWCLAQDYIDLIDPEAVIR